VPGWKATRPAHHAEERRWVAALARVGVLARPERELAGLPGGRGGPSTGEPSVRAWRVVDGVAREVKLGIV
jgi:hypothetical protein